MVSVKGSSQRIPSKEEVKNILERLDGNKQKGGDRDDFNKRFKC